MSIILKIELLTWEDLTHYQKEWLVKDRVENLDCSQEEAVMLLKGAVYDWSGVPFILGLHTTEYIEKYNKKQMEKFNSNYKKELKDFLNTHPNSILQYTE